MIIIVELRYHVEIILFRDQTYIHISSMQWCSQRMGAAARRKVKGQ